MLTAINGFLYRIFKYVFIAVAVISRTLGFVCCQSVLRCRCISRCVETSEDMRFTVTPMSEGKKLPQYLAAVCICVGAMGTGTILGWTSNITPGLKKGDLNDLKLSDDDLGWAGSAMTLGALVMCFPIGFLADWIGRKPTVLLTIIPFTIGWALIIFAKHVAMIYLGRFLTGMAGGSFCITAPLYTSEIAQTEIRGTLGTFFQLFITIGILYANVFGYVVNLVLFCFMCAIVPLVFGVVFFFCPETPVYSLKKGKQEKAEKAFKRLRGDEYNAANEIKSIQENIAKEEAYKGKFGEVMKLKASKKAAFICFSLMFFQQLGGINAVIFYTNEIFTAAGSSMDSSHCTIMIGVVQVIATVIAAWLVEKVGRKILMIASCGLCGLSTLLLGVFFTIKNRELMDKEGVKTIGFLPIMAVVLYIIGFSIGLGPIPWLASAEINPPEVMAKLSAGAGTFNWFLAFLVSRFYLNLANAIGNDITFYIFTAVSLIGVVFVLIIMPETKNKTFAEIQEELGGGQNG